MGMVNILFEKELNGGLGAYGELLVLGKEYTTVIILGTVLQVFGTGMVPFMRNYGGAMWAMIAMICGFATNVTLDYILVWVMNRGMTGAALATVIGQGVTMAVALVYCAAKKKLFLKMTSGDMGVRALQIIKIGLAPFGLTLAPEISLVVINRFSASRSNRCAVRFFAGSQCGNHNVMPIFLLSLPADAVTRVTSAAFYATEKSVWSYLLILSEPVFTLVLVLILPPLLGGQIMIWWSSVAAKIITAVVGIVLSVFIKMQKGHEPNMWDVG